LTPSQLKTKKRSINPHPKKKAKRLKAPGEQKGSSVADDPMRPKGESSLLSGV